MRYRSVVFYSSILFFNNIVNRIETKPYDTIVRFLQNDLHGDDEELEHEDGHDQDDDTHEEINEDAVDDDATEGKNENDVESESAKNFKEGEKKPLVEDGKKTPSWVDEQDLIAEFESSQSERAKELSIKALQKRRAANSLRVYCEGIEEELKRAKERTNGLQKLDSYKLTSQLEANLARASLLYKQADLLDEKAKEANKSLEMLKSKDKDKLILRGPLWYSSRGDNVVHKSKEPLMAKLTGNSLVLYNNKLPQLTYYLVDIEMPTKPVESASRCLSFGYRGSEQVFCGATEQSAHTWMNAITEAWFCKNLGIKGTLVNLKNIEKTQDNKSILMHAVKEKENTGIVNMEVFVDDKNKTHLLVEGKEKPLSAISDIIDVNQVIKDKKSKG